MARPVGRELNTLAAAAGANDDVGVSEERGLVAALGAVPKVQRTVRQYQGGLAVPRALERWRRRIVHDDAVAVDADFGIGVHQADARIDAGIGQLAVHCGKAHG